MMRVAVVTKYFPSSQSPWAGRSAYQTLRLLQAQCDLRVFDAVATYPGLLAPRAAGPAVDYSWRPPEVDVSYIPYPALPVLSRALNGFTMARRLLPHVASFKPDLILNWVVYPDGLAAVRIAHTLGIPVVLTAIGSDLNRMSDPLCALLTRNTLRRADFVTTVSHDLAQTALRLGAPPGRTRAVLNGCDTGTFYPRDCKESRRALNLPTDAEIILYLGRLDLRKGLRELVDAMVVLHASRPQARCFVLGDGEDEAALREQIEQHSAGAFITLAPPCYGDEVAVWIGASDLVTLPSYAEGCPNVILEALNCGRPVVATRVGGIPELMDDSCGELVPPANVPALAAALDHVLGRRWDAAQLSAGSRRSWLDVANELSTILLEVTGQR